MFTAKRRTSGRHSPCDCFSTRDSISSIIKRKSSETELVDEPWILYRYTPEGEQSAKVDEQWVDEFQADDSSYDDTSLYQEEALTEDCDASSVTCKSFVMAPKAKSGVHPDKSLYRKKMNKPFHSDMIARWINQLETVEEVDTDFHSPPTSVCYMKAKVFIIDCMLPFFLFSKVWTIYRMTVTLIVRSHTFHTSTVK